MTVPAAPVRFKRDLAVAAWCRAQGVSWVESPQTSVVRRLHSRTGWAGRWVQRMNAPEGVNLATKAHIARTTDQTLDFEPGTTGLYTLRIYAPRKQAHDYDPTGAYVRQWMPKYGTPSYPSPIVDERAALAAAKDRPYGLRDTGIDPWHRIRRGLDDNRTQVPSRHRWGRGSNRCSHPPVFAASA